MGILEGPPSSSDVFRLTEDGLPLVVVLYGLYGGVTRTRVKGARPPAALDPLAGVDCCPAE
jgi:hypothetical protein